MKIPPFHQFVEFDRHSAVFELQDPGAGLQAFVAFHRENPGKPSFGATRFWSYASKGEALQDALRLSRLMSYKSALAGLPYGGAKGVIVMPEGDFDRAEILAAYAKAVSKLNGRFVTGTDVGMYQEDLYNMKAVANSFVGLTVDPTFYTGLGLSHALKVCLTEAFENSQLGGRTFAIEGLGKVGVEFLKRIYDDAKKIFVCDIDETRVQEVQKNFPRVEAVSPGEIHALAVDVYSPCAVSHSLNSRTLPQLKCRIILGGANNQLEHEDIGKALERSGILYAPDYVVNAGGLMSVAAEYEDQSSGNGASKKENLEAKVQRITETLRDIIQHTKKMNKATNIVANEMAEAIFERYNMASSHEMVQLL